MKRLSALLTACALSLSLLSGCGGPPAPVQDLKAPVVTVTPADSAQVSQALASFGLELLQRARANGDGPVLLSPLSAALALSMAANGAEGDTLAQFQTVLGGGTSLEELNAACALLMADYQNLEGSTKCSIANSLWADPDGQIREDFVGKCQGIFDAQVLQAELSDPSIVRALNRWVSDHTSKMIPEIISEPFPEETAALLVNALYLKNTWARKFDPHSTRQQAFTHQNGDISHIDFLNAYETKFPYLQTGDAQGAVLPYDDGRLGFLVLMPDLYPDAPSFGVWLAGLKGDALTNALDEAQEAQFLRLSLPKFEAEWSGELRDLLAALGLDIPFDPDRADFSLLGDDPDGYFLSQVIHAAKLEVNEKGTEAAAATVVEPNAGTAPPPPDGIRLVLDRPFLYGIVDLETGVPLFLGTYE